MAVKKLKPTMTNQMFANERLADFLSEDPRDTQDISAVSWWFDFKLKEKSNLPDEIDILADFKYVFGHGILKVYWDEDRKCLGFDAIEPIFIIVPDGTKELQESEYLVHVKHLSRWDYRHGPDSSEYNQEEGFVKKITGDGRGDNHNEEQEYLAARRLSDGITHSTDRKVIVIWEVFERTGKGKEIQVHTLCPVCWREEVRPSFALTYRNAKIPFIDFPLERISKSFYSSRGISELGAAFQGYLCKTWNAKSDSMDLWNNPPLTSSKEIPMVGNVKSGPGVIIPFPVQPIVMPAPAISWDQEMANTRDIAEQLFAVPDFGIGQKGFDAGKRRSADKTATETQYIASVTNTMMDAQQRLDRRQLGKLYNQAWDILYQFDDDMQYLHDKEFLCPGQEPARQGAEPAAFRHPGELEHHPAPAEGGDADLPLPGGPARQPGGTDQDGSGDGRAGAGGPALPGERGSGESPGPAPDEGDSTARRGLSDPDQPGRRPSDPCGGGDAVSPGRSRKQPPALRQGTEGDHGPPGRPRAEREAGGPTEDERSGFPLQDGQPDRRGRTGTSRGRAGSADASSPGAGPHPGDPPRKRGPGSHASGFATVMLLVPTFLAKSMVHGYGCFAGQRIVPGTIVWLFDPEVDHVLAGHYSHWERLHAYGSRKLDDLVLARDNAAWLNFSETPNLRVGYLISGEESLIASRPIAWCEELTVPLNSDSDAEWKMNPEL